MASRDPDGLDPAALRDRVRALEQAIEAGERREQALRDEVAEVKGWFQSLVEMTGEAVSFSERGILLEVNQRFASIFGYGVDEIAGASAMTVTAPEFRAIAQAHIAAGSTTPYESAIVRKDGRKVPVEARGASVQRQGRPMRLTVLRDLTERKRAEDALRATLLQEEMIRAQQEILAQLSTPLLPVREDVLVLPLIGAVNARRAEQVLVTLVEGVAANQSRTAILDITGVPDLDAQVADVLLRAARAAQLLGAEVVLTGIRPEVAQRFAVLGTDLSGIVTYGTLQRGILHAFSRR